MDNDSFTEKDKYVNLSNITKLVSFSLFIAVIFTLIRYHFYYQVLLHIPIFQFVDTSELLLMAPTSAVTWIFYLGTFALTDFIKKNDDFTSFQKIIFPIIIYFVGISYIWINYLNDPIIRECIKLPWHYKYWFIWFPLLILCVVAYQFPNTKQPHFFKRNKFIIPLVLTIWYALFEGWANYEVVTTSKHTNNMIVKTKSLGTIKTDSIIINAGRTKNYWFYYDRNTQVTRVIKIDDIEFIDFNAANR